MIETSAKALLYPSQRKSRQMLGLGEVAGPLTTPVGSAVWLWTGAGSDMKGLGPDTG